MQHAESLCELIYILERLLMLNGIVDRCLLVPQFKCILSKALELIHQAI